MCNRTKKRNLQWEFVDDTNDNNQAVGPIILDGPTASTYHGCQWMQAIAKYVTDVTNMQLSMYTLTLDPIYHSNDIETQYNLLRGRSLNVFNSFHAMYFVSYEKTQKGVLHAHAIVEHSNVDVIKMQKELRALGFIKVVPIFDFDGAYYYITKEELYPVDFS